MMQETKPKFIEQPIIWWRFLGIWITGGLIGWFVTEFLMWNVYLRLPQNIYIFAIWTIVPGFFSAVAQSQVMPRSISRSAMTWFLVTMLGHVLSMAVLRLTIDFEVSLYSNLLWVILFSVPAIVQWLFILRGRIRFAWLWPVSSAIFAFASWLGFSTFSSLAGLGRTPFYYPAALVALASSVLMLWLLYRDHMTVTQSKNK